MRHLKSILVSSLAILSISAIAQDTNSNGHSRTNRSEIHWSGYVPLQRDGWNGTSTTVVNQSGAASGFQSGATSFTTASVPSGALPGTGSMALTGVGTPHGLLNNAVVAGVGGI